MALYASFVYGILYAKLAAFPVEFHEESGRNLVISLLPFLAILIGILLGGAANVQSYHNRRFTANGKKARPEARLPRQLQQLIRASNTNSMASREVLLC